MTILERSEVRWGSTEIRYLIRRSDRRGTVGIAVEPSGAVVLTAPRTASVPRLDKLVREKARWIVNRVRRREALPAGRPREFVSGESFHYLGRQYRLRVHVGASVRPIALRGGWLDLPVPAALNAEEARSYAGAALIDWFTARARERLPSAVATWAERLGVSYREVVVTSQAKRWGTCSNEVVRLNWRIVQAPRSLLDYVVAHEVTLPDGGGSKGLGPVGSPNCPATGLIMMNALAMTRDGVPLGPIDQIWLSRPARVSRTRAQHLQRNASRPFEDKEPSKVLDAAKNSVDRLALAGIDALVVIDREADNADVLLGLHELGCRFTVRGGKYDRRVLDEDLERVHPMLDAQPSLGTYEVEAKLRGGNRRPATVDVRAAQVTLRFGAYAGRPGGGLRLFAVRIRDVSGAADGPDWLSDEPSIATTTTCLP